MERRYIAYNIEICLEYNWEALELKWGKKGIVKISHCQHKWTVHPPPPFQPELQKNRMNLHTY